MEIILTENPLCTKVILTDCEKQILRLKLELEDLAYKLAGVDMYLNDTGQFYNLEKAKREAASLSLTDEQFKKRSDRFDEMVNDYVDELQLNHIGDCTCVAASCSKCHAESLIGIDTLGKIGKHELSYVDSAFRNEEVKTCKQAIAYLIANPPSVNEDWHADHIERWTQEHARAIEYLKLHLEKLKENMWAKIKAI